MIVPNMIQEQNHCVFIFLGRWKFDLVLGGCLIMLPALAHVIRPLKLLIELELEESVVQQNSRIHLSGKSGHFFKTLSADLVVVYLPTEQNVRLLQWRIFRIRDLLQVRQRKK